RVIGGPESPKGCQQTAEQAMPAPGQRIRKRPTLPGGLPEHFAARNYPDRLLVYIDLQGRLTPQAFREHGHAEEGDTTCRSPPDRASDQGPDTSEESCPRECDSACGHQGYGSEMLLHD